MRTRNYQRGLGAQFEDLTDIPSPKDSPTYIGPPILGVNKREKRSEIKPNESPNCKNARILRNYIEPRPQFTLISSSFDSTIVYIREFSVSTGESYLLVITTKSLYYSANLSTFTRVPYPYTAGTAQTNGSTSVVGTNTLWATNVRPGDRFKINSIGTYAIVQSVNSNTSLTLTSNYSSSGGSVAYTIDRYFGGDEDNLFWGVTLADSDYFVFSQGIDPVMFVTSILDSISRLSPDCPAANYGVQYADRLIIGDIPNYPYRIKWSVAGNYSNWTGVGSGYKDWVEDPYGITGFSVIGGVLVVYKSYSINHITRTGRVDDPFNFETKVPGIGCYFGGSLVSLGDADIFIGSDNVYTYDLRSVEPVGDNIKDSLLNDVNPAYTHTSHALVVEEHNEVQFYYASVDNTAPNKAIVYNYDMNIWSGEWEFNSPVHASGYATQEVTESWDSDDRPWDSDSTEWDSNVTVSALPLNMVAQGSSLYKQEPTTPTPGANLNFIWETKDFASGEEIKAITAYRVVVSYHGLTSGNIIFETSTTGGQSWQNYQVQPIDTSTPSRVRYMFFDLITTGEVICGRFRSVDGGRFQSLKLDLKLSQAGR